MKLRHGGELLLLAWLALRSRWLRSFLSILGIAIGILAFTVTASISLGGRALVFTELQTFGLRSVWVTRDTTALGLDRADPAPGSGIDAYDLADLHGACCTAVHAFTPAGYPTGSMPVRSGNSVSSSSVLGVSPSHLAINGETLRAGRNFNEFDERHGRYVAMIGPKAAQDLFKDGKPAIGARIELGEFSFEIIGVLAEKNRDFLNSIGIGRGEDVNRRVLVPYTTLQRMHGRIEIDYLQLESSSSTNAIAAGQQVLRVLQRNHGSKYRYKAEDMQQYVIAAERILGSISLVGMTASVLSLLIGGIGIANVMGMSVLERTREIGVRKAIGATRRAILLQFGLESLLISVMGGAFGVALSYAGIAVARRFTTLALYPTAEVLLYALCVAGFTGIAAGLYPAYVAANMKPTHALRS